MKHYEIALSVISILILATIITLYLVGLPEYIKVDIVPEGGIDVQK